LFSCYCKIRSCWNQHNWSIFQDIIAITEDGENISVIVLAYPHNSSEPLLQDFAILKVSKTTKNKVILPLSSNITHIVQNLLYFQDIPRHACNGKSRWNDFGITNDKSLICIQASTNKGNSGGALVNNKVKSLAISLRERRNICPT
jgi:hypothetical protein